MRIGRYLLGALLAFTVAIGGLYIYVNLRIASGNFGVVVPGEVYRSAQVTPEMIRDYRERYGIATILNLRPPSPGADWYDAEVATSAELGIMQVDFGMSSGRMLPLDRAKELIALMERLPKPLLIHCDSGANRTGLASALYLAVIEGRPEDEAEAQLSLRYGHFPIEWPDEISPMYATFEALEYALALEDDESES